MIERFNDRLGIFFRHQTESRNHPRRHREELLAAVEKAVNEVSPGIRIIAGYQRKLRGPVEHALDYAERMVERIPGVIDIDRQAFASDDRVNAFFVNVDDLQTVSSRSSELQDFFCDRERSLLAECYAFMCMQMTERTVLGMEQDGDRVKRDVRQTTVSFSDHQVHAPAATEADARKSLKECLVQSLLTNALERIGRCRLSLQQLESEHRCLHARLRSLETRRARAQAAQVGPDGPRLLAETQAQLAANEELLGKVHCRGPKDSLEQLHEVLSQPEQCVRVKRFSLKLNKMGVKIAEDAAQPANRIDLSEVQLGESSRRVVILGRFARAALATGSAFPRSAQYLPR